MFIALASKIDYGSSGAECCCRRIHCAPLERDSRRSGELYTFGPSGTQALFDQRIITPPSVNGDQA